MSSENIITFMKRYEGQPRPTRYDDRPQALQWGTIRYDTKITDTHSGQFVEAKTLSKTNWAFMTGYLGSNIAEIEETYLPVSKEVDFSAKIDTYPPIIFGKRGHKADQRGVVWWPDDSKTRRYKLEYTPPQFSRRHNP